MKRGEGLKAGGELAKITVAIRPGPASPAQKQAWKRFWQKLLAEVKTNERQ